MNPTIRQQQIAHYLSLAYPEFTQIVATPTSRYFEIEVIAWGVKGAGATREQAGAALEIAKRKFVEDRLTARLPIPMPQDAEKQNERWRLSLAALRTAIVESAFANGVDIRRSDLANTDIDDVIGLIIGVTRQQSSRSSKKAKKANAKSQPVSV